MMAGMGDARVNIGHIHLRVSNLDRAIAFYQNVLGFEVAQRIGDSAAFLGTTGAGRQIGLNTWDGGAGTPGAPAHFGIQYPGRPALGDALRRLERGGVQVDAAHDHGVTEALYVRDPDGNGVELYWERPTAELPADADGLAYTPARPLDLSSLRAAADQVSVPAPDSPYAPMDATVRSQLRELRTRLLALHKVLLDDARTTYEMDRGRVTSNASMLQLVINDPWFAWLHALSELVVRIDQAVEHETPATGADAVLLVESVERLLTASENGDGFARRYYEALQRQPAVVLAHAAVRRAVKDMK